MSGIGGFEKAVFKNRCCTIAVPLLPGLFIQDKKDKKVSEEAMPLSESAKPKSKKEVKVEAESTMPDQVSNGNLNILNISDPNLTANSNVIQSTKMQDDPLFQEISNHGNEKIADLQTLHILKSLQILKTL